MIEKVYIELMQKEIDGVIDPQEKEELHAYLKTNDEASRYYHDLAQIANLLKEIPEVNPPENLKARILDSLDWSFYSSKKKILPQISLFRDWIVKPRFKLAYSFALGVMVGVLIFALILSFINNNGTLDTNDLYGTIGLHAKKGVEELQRVPIQLDEITGNIHLRRFKDFIIFDVNLLSQLNSELLLEYESSDYQFRGIQQNRNNKILFEEDITFIKVSNTRDAMYQIYFSNKSSKPAPIDLKILVSSRVLLHQSVFVNIN